MAIRITVPTELEESIVAWAEEAGVDPGVMAVRVLTQGVSRRRNLATYAASQAKSTKAQKRGPGRPRKTDTAEPAKRGPGRPRKAVTAPVVAKKRGRPPKAKVAVVEPPKPRAVAKALAPKKPQAADEDTNEVAAQ